MTSPYVEITTLHNAGGGGGSKIVKTCCTFETANGFNKKLEISLYRLQKAKEKGRNGGTGFLFKPDYSFHEC